MSDKNSQNQSDQEFDAFLNEDDQATDDDSTDSPESEEDAAAQEDTSKSEPQAEGSLAPSVRDRQKKLQVDAWVRKIESGEASMDSLGKEHQWLKPHIEEKLNSKDLDSIVTQRVKDELEARDRLQFEVWSKGEKKKLLEQAKGMELDAIEKKELQAKYQSLQDKGLEDLSAFEEAIQYVELLRKSDNATRETLRKEMSIPPIQTKKTDGELEFDNTIDFSKKGTSKDRVKALEKSLNKR